MSRLVEQLKMEHIQITESLRRVTDLGVATIEGQAALRVARFSLLAHLKREDDHFYPVLYDAAEKDPALKRLLYQFAADMQAISESARNFFEKYAEGGAGIAFARDYGRLVADMADRINKEENVLYNKFDEITAARRDAIIRSHPTK